MVASEENRFEVCDRCGHKIEVGVACDVQPAHCPFLQQDKVERGDSNSYPYHIPETD